MRWALFYHSLVSDWNHGNAHFLRGVVSELLDRGDEVRVFESEDGWSRQNLLASHGDEALEDYRRAYPGLISETYRPETLDLDRALDGADAVLVHEWNDADLVRRIGHHRARHPDYRLLFHDTHHRCVTAPEQMQRYDLTHYDGVLAFGQMIRDVYLDRGWAQRAWTWHEAADTRVFRPQRAAEPAGQLIWIGNWGDEERSEELQEFLLDPVAQLSLAARVHGVRYPEHGRQALASAGIEYADWLPNFRVPEAFGQFQVTVHIPRRPYRERLPGIPTIRVFEALACGIPLITAPWEDSEGLFRPGEDYLVAHDGAEMRQRIQEVLREPELGRQLAERGLQTIRARHTCRHRVDELLDILRQLDAPAAESSELLTS